VLEKMEYLLLKIDRQKCRKVSEKFSHEKNKNQFSKKPFVNELKNVKEIILLVKKFVIEKNLNRKSVTKKKVMKSSVLAKWFLSIFTFSKRIL
jgi:hypothetical protein